MTDTHPYEPRIRRELEAWPGASVSFSIRGKHAQATLRYRDAERFVIMPATPSDSRRGAENAIAAIRKELLALGAVREAKPARPAARTRNRSVRPFLPHLERAPVKENPWEALDNHAFSRHVAVYGRTER